MPIAGLTEEATSQFAQLGDYRLHYNEAGSGDVVIMLHGGGAGATGWSNFVRNIGVFAEHYRVLLVDQAGFGKSDKPLINETADIFDARKLTELLDHLGVEKAHLIGNSKGGVTSLRMALNHPERVDRIAVMGSPGYVAPISVFPTEGQKALINVYAGDGPTKEKLQALFNVMLYDPSVVDDALLESRLALALDKDTMAWQAHQRKIPFAPGGELWKELQRINQRTLIIWGRDDRVVPLDGALFMLRQLPDARLHVFSHCGHWAQVERYQEFNTLVMGFLGEE